jgi:hypothetical protein
MVIAPLSASIERFGPDHSATFRANKRRLRNDADDENQPTSHFVPNESRNERKREVNLPADFALLLHWCNTCAAIAASSGVIACVSVFSGSRYFSFQRGRTGVSPVEGGALWTN